MNVQNWISVSYTERLPFTENDRHPRFVLAVDGKGRMGVAYCRKVGALHRWVSAKSIGIVTHWMELPEPPRRKP